MLEWNQLHQTLETSANRHLKLSSLFEQFAKHVEYQVTPQDFHIKGITVSLYPEQGFFATTFAGRTLHFVFSSTAEDGKTLVGNVTCYLKRGFPEQTYIEIGSFTFNGNGQSNLIEPEHDESLPMNIEIPSLYIALHFINESLYVTKDSNLL